MGALVFLGGQFSLAGAFVGATVLLTIQCYAYKGLTNLLKIRAIVQGALAGAVVGLLIGS